MFADAGVAEVRLAHTQGDGTGSGDTDMGDREEIRFAVHRGAYQRSRHRIQAIAWTQVSFHLSSNGYLPRSSQAYNYVERWPIHPDLQGRSKEVNNMQPSGIHLLLTYKCNASCDHCFLSCGPSREGLISLDEVRKYVEDATAAPYINHFFIEGGEPFLYPRLLRDAVAEITARGFWLGILTNGFWATSEREACVSLEPLVEAGLSSIGISTDAWHNRFVPVERAELAARVAGEMGLDANLMACTGGADGETVLARIRKDGLDISPSPVSCRGRAATSDECQTKNHKWQKLTDCPEPFGGSSRVHLGQDGQIHLCQGLLLGHDARQKPLVEIFADFKVEDHPVCAALSAGGPAALARLAASYGFVSRDKYADGCQLCYEARRHLMPHYPHLIGPAEMFTDTEVILNR